MAWCTIYCTCVDNLWPNLYHPLAHTWIMNLELGIRNRRSFYLTTLGALNILFSKFWLSLVTSKNFILLNFGYCRPCMYNFRDSNSMNLYLTFSWIILKKHLFQRQILIFITEFWYFWFIFKTSQIILIVIERLIFRNKGVLNF